MASTASAPADPPVAADFPATLPLSLLAFHSNVGPIYKASQAKYGAFADLQTVLEAVTPALLDQGLVLSQRLIPGPDGSTLLRTSLIHAPSGETLDSEWQIPNLDDLLGRVHALRQQVIERFPIDLPLAAAGALPFVMPPRPAAAPAAAAAADGAAESANGNGSSRTTLPTPCPDRPPGLRLDDQLKGLHTLLGQLGTTTNPLHSLGGVVTYCRRYQILSLLSLAAEDNDGEDSTQPPSRSRSAAPVPVPVPVPTPAQTAAEPAGSRSRTRRSSKAGAEAPAPAPAPVPAPAAPELAPDRQADQPQAARPQPIQAPAPQPAQPPVEQPSEPPAPQELAAAIPTGTVAAPSKLTAGQVEALIAEIRTLSAAQIPQVVAGFRHRFSIPATALVSDYIQTADHAVFLREQIAQLKQPVAL